MCPKRRADGERASRAGLRRGDLHVSMSPVSPRAGPGLGSAPARTLTLRSQAPPPAGCAGAAGTGEGCAPVGQDGRQGRCAPRLSLQSPSALDTSGTVRAWGRMRGCKGRGDELGCKDAGVAGTD